MTPDLPIRAAAMAADGSAARLSIMNTNTTPAPAPDTARAPGGWLFQRYLRWAEPRYARMPADLGAWSRNVDLWLYTTPTGRAFAATLLLALAGIIWGLTKMHIPFFAAVPGGGILWLGVIGTTLGPWMKPERFEGRRMLRVTGVSFLLGVMGAACGLLLATLTGHDVPSLQRFAFASLAALPLVVGLVALLLLVQWGVASWRRHVLAQEVERLQLVHERDQSALRSQQAELRLLHAQIQPHFIFNTLAALQHWVDNGDPRAGPLLHTLTGFLRAGTELIGRERVTIAEEASMAAQYLTIMQQRLGARLAWRDEIPSGLLAQSLPSGLLMTLVENAIEHGVEASLRAVTVVLGGDSEDDRLRLWVDDDGPGWPASAAPTEGLGLANVRSRLHHAFGPGARLRLEGLPSGGFRAALEWTPAPAIENHGKQDS